jgi:hypothetical protein
MGSLVIDMLHTLPVDVLADHVHLIKHRCRPLPYMQHGPRRY